jgi:FKBP-type peptidyl-prolyl cis-trans isomerase SlyD
MLFDTTDEKVAKEEGLFDPNTEYGPVVIALGEGHVLEGLDAELEGKEPGEYAFELTPEKAFGRKNPKLIQLIPTNKFKKQNINPMPGMQVNIDNTMGIIRTVTGGRTLVDFNHPLSGKDVVYTVKVNRVIKDKKRMAEAYLDITLRMKDKEVTVEDEKAVVKTKIELPPEITEQISEKMKELIGLKEIEFVHDKDKEEKK